MLIDNTLKKDFSKGQSACILKNKQIINEV